MTTPEKFSPPKSFHPEDSAPPKDFRGSESEQVNSTTPEDFSPPEDSSPPKNSTPTPEDFSPGTVREPENSSTKSSSNTVGGAGGDALFDAPEGKRTRRKAAAGKQPIATRIPDDFAVTPDMRKWAAEKIPGYDIDAETENFIDYWRQQVGSKALKADWEATWRTWMRRNARESAPPSRPNGQRPNGQPPSGRTKQVNYPDEEYTSGWR